MKLRDKDAEGFFIVTDPVAVEEWEIYPEDRLTSRQVSRVAARPEMAVQFAHHLADQLRREGRENVEVRSFIMASLNGREPQLLIDPDVDLASVPIARFGHAEWILPLETPLREPKSVPRREVDNQ